MQEQIRKCGCEYHLKMSSLIAALQKWRKAVRKLILREDPDHKCAACQTANYFEWAKDLSTFADHLCPCPRATNGLRKLDCAAGRCDVCSNSRSTFARCEAESKFDHLPVKYKWLRSFMIGKHNATEWAYVQKDSYPEFQKLLLDYFESPYRLHNWVYKQQDRERHLCRDRMKKGDVILEFDYAAKMTCFQQDAMPCSAARQTSNFVVFAHFNPKHDDMGKNIDDTTEVFKFHSDCTKQDTHSIRRALTHVLQNLAERGAWGKDGTAHLWADGCGSQNKGRKSFRQWSELSAEFGRLIVANFPATSHFGGQWDAEGGRDSSELTVYKKNQRDDQLSESVLCAQENVTVLRRVQKNAGEPDPPVASQKQWRPIPKVGATTAAPQEPPRVPVPKPSRGPKQSRGRTAEEMADMQKDPERYVIQRRHIWQMEPCSCRRVCKCPEDGRLTYKRNTAYDCTAISGTLSTYCYMFNKKALTVYVRQYSCYCRWCSRKEWSKCISLAVVKHRPEKPIRPLAAGFQKWRDQGWRTVVLKPLSAPDRAVTRIATQSVEAAKDYVRALDIGATFAVLHTNTDNDERHFWLASKQSKIKKASRGDRTTGVKKNELILDIVWYDRMTDYKYAKVDYQSIVSVSSVLVTVSNIMWNRTTTNRFYLGETTHNMLLDIARSRSEI